MMFSLTIFARLFFYYFSAQDNYHFIIMHGSKSLSHFGTWLLFTLLQCCFDYLIKFHVLKELTFGTFPKRNGSAFITALQCTCYAYACIYVFSGGEE